MLSDDDESGKVVGILNIQGGPHLYGLVLSSLFRECPHPRVFPYTWIED
jgi:hypothetical protein